MTKKILIIAVLLCLLSVHLTVPVSATQGTFGDNITWKFEDGILTISGSGALEVADPYPWGNYKKDTTTLIVESGITSISSGAFSGFGVLTSVSLPDTVTSIGEKAFSACKWLKSVYLGAGISSISKSAFKECKELEAFTVSPDNPYFTTDNGFIYSKSLTELVLGPQGYQGRLTILPGTAKINREACYGCTGITEVIFPDSVTIIENSAFSHCSGIQSVSLSNSLRTIEVHGFNSCTSLTEITFPASLMEIGTGAFGSCSSLKRIIFTGMGPYIERAAFYEVTAIVFYPTNKPGWSGTKKSYGGLLQWNPLEDICKGVHTSAPMPAVSPTCTKSGSKDGTECAVCGTVLTQPTIIPETGHTFTQWQTVEKPTETKPGFEKRSCSVCGHWQTRDIYMDKIQQTPTQPPVTEPPVTEPPVTEPPVTEPPVTEPPVTEPPVTESVVTEPEESTAAPESTATENLASSPTMPVDTASGNEKNSIRTWVVGISATIVLVAAIAATIVGSIQKKKE